MYLSDDGFGSFFAIAMLIVSIMTVAGSFNYMRKRSNPAIYFSLILLSSIGMVLIAFATDLVMLFVAWELMSIPTYILAGFNKKNPSSNEAAIKYFLFGALSSGIIIYGISLAYGITGSTNIGDVIYGFANLSPEHATTWITCNWYVHCWIWIQDGTCSIPHVATRYIRRLATNNHCLTSSRYKESRICCCTRIIIMGAAALNLDWTLALGVIAIMTMTIGNVAAIMQKNLTRMLSRIPVLVMQVTY